MSRCTFLGLGVMGYPMAGHLAAAGHEVTVWNRTSSKAKAWAGQHGGQAADTVEAAVAEADFVMACLGDDPDVRAVAEQAFPAMKPGAILIDHTRPRRSWPANWTWKRARPGSAFSMRRSPAARRGRRMAS